MTTLLYAAALLLAFVVGCAAGVWFTRRDQAEQFDRMFTAAAALHAQRPRPREQPADPPGSSLTALLDALQNEKGID